MPFIQQFVKPDAFLEYKGKTIFNAYFNNDYEDSCYFIYTTSASNNIEFDDFLFDVREIRESLIKKGVFPISSDFYTHEIKYNIDDNSINYEKLNNIIRLGIDHGLIKFPEE